MTLALNKKKLKWGQGGNKVSATQTQAVSERGKGKFRVEGGAERLEENNSIYGYKVNEQ